jgi:hypothetical protein
MVSLTELRSIVIIFTVIGIFLGLGGVILNEIQVSTRDSSTQTNESITPTANAYTSLARPDIIGITRIQNRTTLVPSGYYNLVSNYYNAFVNVTNASWAGVNYNITYTYYVHDDTSTALQNASVGVLNISTQLPTAGTVFGVLVIVGAVVLIFVLYSRRKEY